MSAQQTMSPPTTAPRNGTAQLDATVKLMAAGTGVIYGRGPNPRRFYRLRTTQTGGYAAANQVRHARHD
jgi:hypothetical protein